MHDPDLFVNNSSVYVIEKGKKMTCFRQWLARPTKGLPFSTDIPW